MKNKIIKSEQKWTLKIFRSAWEGIKGEKSRYIVQKYTYKLKIKRWETNA
jgi:hypothetical protein